MKNRGCLCYYGGRDGIRMVGQYVAAAAVPGDLSKVLRSCFSYSVN